MDGADLFDAAAQREAMVAAYTTIQGVMPALAASTVFNGLIEKAKSPRWAVFKRHRFLVHVVSVGLGVVVSALLQPRPNSTLSRMSIFGMMADVLPAAERIRESYAARYPGSPLLPRIHEQAAGVAAALAGAERAGEPTEAALKRARLRAAQALFNLEQQAKEMGALRRVQGLAGVSAAAPTPAAAAAAAAAAGRPSAAAGSPALDGAGAGAGAGAAASAGGMPMPPPRYSGDPHGTSAGAPRKWDEQLAAAHFSSSAGAPSSGSRSRPAASGSAGYSGSSGSSGSSDFAGRAEEDARFDVAAGRFDDTDDGRFALPADHDAAFRAGGASAASAATAGRHGRAAARDRAASHGGSAAGAGSAAGRVRAADGGVIVSADSNPVLSELFGWSSSSSGAASAGGSPVSASAASPASNGSSPAWRYDSSSHHHHHGDHQPGVPSYEARRRHREELARRRAEER